MNGDDDHIADLIEVSASDRHDKVFWVPYFLVANLEKFSTVVERNGGELGSRSDTDRGSAAFFADTQGATFAVVEG